MKQKSKTIKVRVDETLAEAIDGKNIKQWKHTRYSNGKEYIIVVFEEIRTI